MSTSPRASNVADVLYRTTDLVVDRGEGSTVFTVEGDEYLDFTSGLAVTSTGHCHPDVVYAVRQQAERMLHAQANVYRHPLVSELAGKLSELTGDVIDSWFFANSGAEAVEAAVKLAKQATGRPNVVVFQGGFHGRTHLAMAMTSSRVRVRSGHAPLPSGVHVAPFPDTTLDSEQALRLLDVILATQTDPRETAAFVIEPILGEGGYRPAPDAFLRGLRERSERHGILLVFDEVQTGCGRTGQMFAYQGLGVAPDVLVLAKGLGSGLPISAVGASRAVTTRWPQGSHGGTYGGNPICCAAALATLQVLTADGRLDAVRTLGATLLGDLRRTVARDPDVVDVRGRGLMVAVEFHEGALDRVDAVRSHCLDPGRLILMTAGASGHVIRFMPPLIVSAAEVRRAAGTFADALDATRS